ncbi:MAG: neutral/alkaline non-lysosomal ceramidase N-terminal domain-containing protein [Acidobacteriota bacterium]|nr:neutral/alkaline non-lysosomal ceramidase N-terminal domain-containing protein [Acidobacteriota bacterium]
MQRQPLFRSILLLSAGLLGLHASQAMRAGVARVNITPAVPVWLTGYALRTHPANSVLADIFAKALAIEDGHGGRVVIVTTDLIGLPVNVSGVAATRMEKRLGLKRSEILFNSSHTHTGPTIWPNLEIMLDLTEEQQAPLREYAEKLTDQLVDVAAEALRNSAPATLSYGQGEAGFAINRRAAVLRKAHPGQEFPAPVDHSVPVLRVQRPDGTLLAVLFGYACHNTTLTAEFYEVSGDYAGFTQTEIERSHPGATALFLMLCGGDQNPNPRSSREALMQHAHELAGAVEQTMRGRMQRVGGPVRSAYSEVELPLATHSRKQFEEEASNSDVFRRRRAAAMLRAYDAGAPIRSVTYPVQAVRLRGLTIVALGGEVVVDYAIRLKRELPNEPLVVAGYSNVVMSYIPSLRVWNEGGYEAEDSMIYYGLPGRYSSDVEERVIATAHRVLTAAKAGKRAKG